MAPISLAALVPQGCGGLQGLPQGAVVGTSSLRREAMVRRLRPDLRVVSIRGNLQKRYHKLIHGHEGGAWRQGACTARPGQ